MNIEPKDFDLLRLAGLKPKIKTEEEKRYPTLNTRMMAATIDMLIISFTLAPLVDYAYLHYQGSPPIDISRLINQLSGYANSGEAGREFIATVRESGFWDYWSSQMSWHIVVMMVYVVACWHFWSATPGKILFRMVVVDSKTLKPMSDWQSIGRVFGYFVSLLPFGIGLVWIAFDKQKRAFHDILAGTVVIKKSALKKIEQAAATAATEAAHPSDSLAPSAAE